MLKQKNTFKTFSSSYWTAISGGENPPIDITIDSNKNVTGTVTFQPTENTRVDVYDKYNTNTGTNTIGVNVIYVFPVPK